MRAAGMPKRIKPAKLPEDVWEGDSQKSEEAIREDAIQEGTKVFYLHRMEPKSPEYFVAVPSI
jgi:hypothetical protein